VKSLLGYPCFKCHLIQPLVESLILCLCLNPVKNGDFPFAATGYHHPPSSSTSQSTALVLSSDFGLVVDWETESWTYSIFILRKNERYFFGEVRLGLYFRFLKKKIFAK
jgi:hypothetical protein